MATKYELPEEVNEKRLRTLGKEVEMKTFKTNVSTETSDGYWLVKIICVGDYTGGGRTQGTFIDDYLQVPPPVNSFVYSVLGANFFLKTMEWQRSEAERPFLMRLQFWEMGEHERFSHMTKVFCKDSLGAIVFWGTRNPSSLEGAKKRMQDIRKYLPSIPCVLVTDNIFRPEPLQWIGPGKLFESEVALDQFCKDHGFVDHFEIKSRDWESGEKSVFGQAVNCLLDVILQSEQTEEEKT
ncbi:ras-related protein Rab-38-like [Oculina patagonica]